MFVGSGRSGNLGILSFRKTMGSAATTGGHWLLQHSIEAVTHLPQTEAALLKHLAPPVILIEAEFPA